MTRSLFLAAVVGQLAACGGQPDGCQRAANFLNGVEATINGCVAPLGRNAFDAGISETQVQNCQARLAMCTDADRQTLEAEDACVEQVPQFQCSWILDQAQAKQWLAKVGACAVGQTYSSACTLGANNTFSIDAGF